MSTLYEVPVKTLAGESTTLEPYQGHVLLIVNTASKCGLTPQYEGLQKLYTAYKVKGLDILGFPANDFADQEPGTSEEIQSFCTKNYGVDFPMFEKIAVTGPNTHPLYQTLIDAQPEARIADPSFRANLDGYLSSHGAKTNPLPGLLWNFEKFLVDREGTVVARFAPDTKPDDPALVAAIEAAL